MIANSDFWKRGIAFISGMCKQFIFSQDGVHRCWNLAVFPFLFLCTAQDNQGIKTWLVLTSLGGWLWKWWTFWIQFCFTGYRFESLNACRLDLWVTGIYSFDQSLSLSRGCYKHCCLCNVQGILTSWWKDNVCILIKC